MRGFHVLMFRHGVPRHGGALVRAALEGEDRGSAREVHENAFPSSGLFLVN